MRCRRTKVLRSFMEVVLGLLTVFLFGLLFNSNSSQVYGATANSYTDASGNWKGGTAAEHDAWLKTIVNPNWVSADYASQIPADAKGTDSKTGNPYVDEWLPDKNFQQLLVYDLNLSSANDLTKNILKTDETALLPDIDEQHTNRTYFDQVRFTRSLEGIQYATNLKQIEVTPDQDASLTVWNMFPKGNVSDISALTRDCLKTKNSGII